MPENKRTITSNSEVKEREPGNRNRMERRFVPGRSVAAMLTLGVSILAGLALGVGAYGIWGMTPSMNAASYILGAGAIALVGVLLWGDMDGTIVRVGDGGVAWERGGKLQHRVAWYEMTEVNLTDGVIRLQTEVRPWLLPVASNPSAAAYVMEQANKRIGSRVRANSSELKELLGRKRDNGQLVNVEASQSTGLRCASSNAAITFEQDARRCRHCGQLYHREHLPERCVSCDHPLEDTWAPESH